MKKTHYTVRRPLIFHGVVTVAVSLAVMVGWADTLALYTCEDGVNGEPVGRLVNKLNPSLYKGLPYRMSVTEQGDKPGNLPSYTNTVPGNCIYSDSMCTQIVARMPLAILFSSEYSDLTSGGCIDLENLSRAIHDTGKNSFTVELFWRSSEIRKLGYFATMHDWYRARMGPGSYANYLAIQGKTSKVEPYLGDYSYLHQQGWRHWAMTYDGSTKKARLYYDYAEVGSLDDNFERSSSAFPDFRLGAAVWDATGERFDLNCARGEMTCIRVSDEALDPARFLRMGVAAFYPFKDGEDGAEVAMATNSLVAGDATGTAGCINKMPTFSDDRPGRYIYSSIDKQTLLCEYPNSISFTPVDSYHQPQGHIAFDGLAGRLLMSSSEKSEVTFECFFKKEHFSWGSLVLFSLRPDDSSRRWDVLVNSDSVNSRQMYQYSVSCSNEGESLLNDGRWHHLAVVWGAKNRAWKSVAVYLDYALSTNAVLDSGICFEQSAHWYSWNDKPFVVGHAADFATGVNGFLGKVSAVRITSKALTPDRFMVASDTASGIFPDYGFRWRFEDGAVGGDVGSVFDCFSSEKWTVGEIATNGSGFNMPVYSSEKPARTILIDNEELANRRGIAIEANTAATSTVLENKTWCGLPPLHPKSWTMEFFAKSDGARANNVLLAGRGRLNPSTGEEWCDWVLALQPNGKLALTGYRSDGTGGKTSYAFSDLGANFDNGEWHRVVVAYDGDTTAYQVWLDDGRILNETLSSAQVDSMNARYQFGQGCGLAGFTGYLDEVRFVGRALSPEEFAELKFKGLVMSFR